MTRFYKTDLTKKYSRLLLRLSIIYCLQPASLFSQGTWTPKASHGGTRLGAAAFSIGAKGYIGTGLSNIAPVVNGDFWEWDQATNTWTQKANFGGTARAYAVGFSIGTKGYIGTGSDAVGTRDDFWEWDQATNIWSQKANFGGGIRWAAVGFSIGNKGYIGTGNDSPTGASPSNTRQDFWEWDQATNTWTAKANVGGTTRDRAVGFSIGTKGYIGTGYSAPSYTFYNDFWEWDQTTNAWTQKANYAGGASFEGTGFSAVGYGYIGTGQTSGSFTFCVPAFWKYNPVANTWTKMANFGGGPREFAVGFSIGCKGYVGTGFSNDNLNTVTNDLWEFCPDTACCNSSNLSISTVSQNVLCNGQCNGTASVTISSGTAPYTYAWSPSGGNSSTATGLCAGTYSVLVKDSTNASITSVVTITQPTAISVTVTSVPASCGNNDGTATANVSAGTPAYTYVWSPGGQSTKTVTGLAPGTYTASVTDANGCSQAQTVTVTSSSILSVTISSTPESCTANDATASATPTNGTSPYTYTWNNGQTGQNATGLTAGNYSVTVIDANGCSQIQAISVTQASGPTASASANATTLPLGGSTTLIGTGGGTYQWSPSTGLSCDTCANPTVTPGQTTVYCVTVTDTNNCSDSACVMITVDIPCGTIYLPNAFSPNNDLENDMECVIGNCIETFHLTIYNRWGQVVFESDDLQQCWDGTYKGVLENTAVFDYYLEAITTGGEKIFKKGNISLIR